MKIKLDVFQDAYITSDTHYGHRNLVRGTSEWPIERQLKCRNFETLEAHNNLIVNNINHAVGKDDVLIHFGDWAFGRTNIFELRERINCKTIHLVLGNHDTDIRKNRHNEQLLFTSVSEYQYFSIQKQDAKGNYGEKTRIVGFHYPLASWPDLKNDAWMVHGHLHMPHERRHVGDGKIIDCGIEGHPFWRPYDVLTEMAKIMKSRPNKSLLTYDHHND